MRFSFFPRRSAWFYPSVVALITALLVLAFPRRSVLYVCRRLAARLISRQGRRQTSAQTDPRDAIAAVAAAYVDALLRGSASAYAGAFHDDAIAVPGTGAIARGRDEIENAIESTFAHLRFLEAEMSTVDLRLTGDTAIETGWYRFVVHPYLEAHGVPRTTSGRYAIVWKRVAGAWRISLDVGQPSLVKT